MIVISNQAHLQALGIAASFAVALPDAVCTQKTRVPYVLCLHDYGQNADRLLRMLACDALVDTQNIGLLIPDGQNSCFLDMAYGPHWESYLMNELLPYAQRTFPLQNTPRVFGVGPAAGADSKHPGGIWSRHRRLGRRTARRRVSGPLCRIGSRKCPSGSARAVCAGKAKR